MIYHSATTIILRVKIWQISIYCAEIWFQLLKHKYVNMFQSKFCTIYYYFCGCDSLKLLGWILETAKTSSFCAGFSDQNDLIILFTWIGPYFCTINVYLDYNWNRNVASLFWDMFLKSEHKFLQNNGPSNAIIEPSSKLIKQWF